MAFGSRFLAGHRRFARRLSLVVYLLAVVFAAAQPVHAHLSVDGDRPAVTATNGIASDPCESGQPHDHEESCLYASGHSLTGVVAINLVAEPNGALTASPVDSVSLRAAITLPPLRPPTPVFVA